MSKPQSAAMSLLAGPILTSLLTVLTTAPAFAESVRSAIPTGPAVTYQRAPEASPSQEELRKVVTQEVDRLALTTILETIQLMSGQGLAKDKLKERIVDLLVQNKYLEVTMPKPVVVKMVDDLVEKPKTVSEFREEVIEILTKRRQLYWERRVKSDTNFIGYFDALSTPVDTESYQMFDLYRFKKPITYSALSALVPRIDRLWRRKFDVSQKGKAKVMLFELSDIKGTMVAVFNDIGYMNNVFQRASVFIETKEGLVSGPKVYGTVAGGHDLQGPDLMRFWNEVKQESVSKSLGIVKDEIDYLQRIELEREFFEKVILPTLKERGERNVVFLAASADSGSKRVITHEAWHGKYFTDTEWRTKVQKYWASLPSAVKQEFKHAIKGVGYDTKNEDLMANEFQAYMLQEDEAVSGGTPLENAIEAVQKKMRPAFFKAMDIK